MSYKEVDKQVWELVYEDPNTGAKLFQNRNDPNYRMGINSQSFPFWRKQRKAFAERQIEEAARIYAPELHKLVEKPEEIVDVDFDEETNNDKGSSR